MHYKPVSWTANKSGSKAIFLLILLLLSGCNTSARHPPIALTIPGVILYYPFNGNANDLSTSHNNGQVHGATLTLDRFGVRKHAYEFNGVDNDITFDASKVPLGPSPRTISAWIKAESFPPESNPIGSRATVIGWGLSDWDQLSEMQIVSGRLVFHIYGQKEAYSKTVLELNQWYHLAIVYTDGKVSLYVNGVEEDFEVSPVDTPIGDTGRIGAYPDPHKTGGMFPHGYDLSYFHGAIDDISVYNQALTAGQIMALYTEGGWGK
ncbi:MAG: LamG domain-containing protein [Anaerolineales bacterium]|jgi:hypothetical protein